MKRLLLSLLIVLLLGSVVILLWDSGSDDGITVSTVYVCDLSEHTQDHCWQQLESMDD